MHVAVAFVGPLPLLLPYAPSFLHLPRKIFHNFYINSVIYCVACRSPLRAHNSQNLQKDSQPNFCLSCSAENWNAGISSRTHCQPNHRAIKRFAAVKSLRNLQTTIPSRISIPLNVWKALDFPILQMIPCYLPPCHQN